MDRIVDISQEGLHLSSYRGFMCVHAHREEVGRVAVDDIHALLIHAYSTTLTGRLVQVLAEHGAPVLLCGPNHMPLSITYPIEKHFEHNGRLHAQCAASEPLKKRLWQHIVMAKITMQASLLKARQCPKASVLYKMAKQVKSGDTSNIEGAAARLYWPLLMGENFRRERSAEGANALLNYGYSIMRATVARAIVGVGLHPAFGIGHINRRNSFALADDVVEPFRPIVDAAVVGMIGDGLHEVTPATKACLARLIAFDLHMGDECSPVSLIAQKLAFSIVESYGNKKNLLTCFKPPDEDQWTSLMRGHRI